MVSFNKKHKLVILNEKWEIIKDGVKLKYIPKVNEILYLDEKYYRVVNNIHSISKKIEIFIVVEIIDNDT